VGSPAFHFSGVEQCTILVAVVVASMVFTVPIDTNMSALSLCVVLGHNDTPVLGLVTVSTCTSTPLNIDIRVGVMLTYCTSCILVVVLVASTSTLVLVFSAVQQVAVLVAIADAWLPLRLWVHTQVLMTTTDMCVMLASHHAIIQFSGTGRA
jgi:hypothetical protein